MANHSPLPFDAPAACLPKDVFFEIIDEVLVHAGRQPLEPDGPQRRIIDVRDTDRVLQILAGPGSGKTEMLVLRVLYDLFVRGADPSKLIVTTFTRRAATELVIRTVERAEAIQAACTKRGLKVRDPQVHNLRIGTIHSLCEQILVDHDAGYRDAGRAMIDQAEAYARMYRNLWRLGRRSGQGAVDRLVQRDALIALFTPPWEDNTRVLSGMRLVDVLMGMVAQHLETWVPRCEASGLLNGAEVAHNLSGLTDDLQKVAQRWEEALNEGAVVDFATIQRLFHQSQSGFVSSFDHIFVDEFQDSNPIQFAIHVGWLVNASTRLTVVADDDQSLYRFRGSDIECLIGLEPHCAAMGYPFRGELLDINYRSTKTIVTFSQAFRDASVLKEVGLEKTIHPSAAAPTGQAVHLLEGRWPEVSEALACDFAARGVGRPGAQESAAILMFSTRESDGRRGPSPALVLRRALEAKGVRVFNLGSKTAGEQSSPVAMLFGLISYLIDPISKALPPGATRPTEVWASSANDAHAACAATHPPEFRIVGYHARCQKWFIKHGTGQIGAPEADRKHLTDWIDHIRAHLVKAKGAARLTLAGLIARMLADPLFRSTGFTPHMFRQALFTQLFEANVAPTRLTMESLDNPLHPTLDGGKIRWEKSLWGLLNLFGGYLENANIEDLEVDAFEEDAVLLMTHHRAKGLEFDHVVAAGLGRDLDHGPALRTKLFSGEAIPYDVTDTSVFSSDSEVQRLAMADREREVYVALSRAKSTLTILQDTNKPELFMRPNAAVASLFDGKPSTPHPATNSVQIRQWS